MQGVTANAADVTQDVQQLSAHCTILVSAEQRFWRGLHSGRSVKRTQGTAAMRHGVIQAAPWVKRRRPYVHVSDAPNVVDDDRWSIIRCCLCLVARRKGVAARGGGKVRGGKGVAASGGGPKFGVLLIKRKTNTWRNRKAFRSKNQFAPKLPWDHM